MDDTLALLVPQVIPALLRECSPIALPFCQRWESEQESGLPEGQVVGVTVEPLAVPTDAGRQWEESRPDVTGLPPGQGIRRSGGDGPRTLKNSINTWSRFVNSGKSVSGRLSREFPGRYRHRLGSSQERRNCDQPVPRRRPTMPGRMPTPLAQAFVICRQIYEDTRTHEFILIGPLNSTSRSRSISQASTK